MSGVPKTARTMAELLAVGVCTLAFAFTVAGMAASLLNREAPGANDFAAYWASGQLLAHHANPYAADAILGLERSVGYPADAHALIMRNPPWAMVVALPLGFLGEKAGRVVWSLLLLGCLMVSVRMVWSMYGAPTGRRNLLGYLFAPALGCIAAVQMSLFVLLGLVLFLRLQRSRPYLAGVALWFCMLKPHLFFPFGAVFVAWTIYTRSYKPLLGVATALACSMAVALALDPRIWRHYGEMIVTDHVTNTTMACLSSLLRREVSPHSLWLLYLPAALGCVWALLYFRRWGTDWDWMTHGGLLVLVSLLVAPYAWPVDQCVAIPALLYAAYQTRSRGLLAGLALASATIEIAMFFGFPLMHSMFYLWTAPAWLAWYVLAARPTGERSPTRSGMQHGHGWRAGPDSGQVWQ